MYCFWLPVFIIAFVTLLVTIFIYWRIQGVGNPAMPPPSRNLPPPSLHRRVVHGRGCERVKFVGQKVKGQGHTRSKIDLEA